MATDDYNLWLEEMRVLGEAARHLKDRSDLEEHLARLKEHDMPVPDFLSPRYLAQERYIWRLIRVSGRWKAKGYPEKEALDLAHEEVRSLWEEDLVYFTALDRIEAKDRLTQEQEAATGHYVMCIREGEGYRTHDLVEGPFETLDEARTCKETVKTGHPSAYVMYFGAP